MIKEAAEAYAMNRRFWDELARKGECGFTKPWLDMEPEIVRACAGLPSPRAVPHLAEIFPEEVFSFIDMRDVNVLCLAAGGGQQSAIFGILGANVTVVDISEEQLKGDRRAAEYYDYKVSTVQSDMSELLLKPDSFNLVYQAPSASYLPSLFRLYREVFRGLRKGGLFRADAENPLAWSVDEHSWDGTGYRISTPYHIAERQRSDEEHVMEFRHTLDEVFNSLVRSGFSIERVMEAPRGIYGEENAEPGTWPHVLRYVLGNYAVLARKE